MNYRIGQGLDFHKLVKEETFVIGGVTIPNDKGILGHSDGDLVIHSIVDALLGALAMGDIGSYFPSNDKKWKDIDSRYFLKHVMGIVNKKKYTISNLDCTIILQKPHINQFIDKIRLNLSNLLDISIDNISIKATTTDKLGFIGKGEGVGCIAICLLYKDK